MKKVLKYGFFAVLLIVLILVLVPWLFKDQVFQQVKSEANKQLKGELAISDLSLNLIRNFPNLTLTLDDVVYTCDSTFNGVELFNIQKVRAELDLISVIVGDEIKINGVSIFNPKMNVIIDAEGNENYDIFQEDDTSASTADDTATSVFAVNLKKLIIDNLDLKYTDIPGEIYTELSAADFQLEGDFTQDETDLSTTVDADELTVNYAGINYLTKAAIKGLINAHYNMQSGRITLKDNDVWVNMLNVLFGGWVEMPDDRITMDLTYQAPNSEFKELLSLVPLVYLEGYESVQASGRFSLSGFVKGDYFYEGHDDEMPAFEAVTNINKGSFKYPDLPSAISDINLDLAVKHPGGNLNNMTIDVPSANLVMAASPANLRLALSNVMTDPLVDFAMKTKLNLGKLQDVVKLEDTQLSGLLDVDASLKGAVSNFEQGNIDRVFAQGYLALKNFVYSSSELKETVRIDSLNTLVQPNYLSVDALKMAIGNSDFSGTGKLYNMLGYLLANQTLSGNLQLASDKINITELMAAMADDEAPQTAAAATSTAVAVIIPDNIDLTLGATATEVVYDNINLKNVGAKALVKNKTVALKDVHMDVFDGTMNLDGLYSTPDGKPKFDMDLGLSGIDIKSAFSGLNTLQLLAPVAASAIGKFGGTLSLSSFLSPEFTPDLTSLTAHGSLLTKALSLQPQVMQTIGGMLKNDNLQQVKVADTDLSFDVEDNQVKVKPVQITVGGFKGEFSGSQGLDQNMNYLLKTELPIAKISLPQQVAGLNLGNGGNIPVTFAITGTVTNPKIKPVFGEGANAVDLVTNVVKGQVANAKDSAVSAVNKQGEKIMADAQKRADDIMAKANAQAAQIKADAKTQADKMKADAKAQADKLVAEAGNNPIAKTAARAAADKVLKEADKKIDALNAKADQQADAVVQSAQNQADAIMKDAEEKAKL